MTDKPNEFGRMKIKFPMTASLEGAQQKIKINDTDDYLIVYHNVDIETSKKLAINETAHTKKNSTSKIGVLQMELESGKIIIEPRASDDQRVTIIHEVNIQIDLDSEIPNIYISPVIKGHICLE